MGHHLTNYRLWIWQGRFLGIVALMQSVSGREFTTTMVVAAMAYGLAAYFRERQ